MSTFKWLSLLFFSFIFTNVFATPYQSVVASGGYKIDDSYYTYPLLIERNGQGKWSYVNKIQNKPTDASLVIFSNADCNGLGCVLVGLWMNPFATNPPFIASHQLADDAWTYIDNSTGLPDNHYQVTLYNVNCDKEICSAIGSVVNSQVHYAPVALYSSDHGKSWQQAVLPDEYQSGIIDKLSCNANICVVEAMGGTVPLMLSKDHGKTWDYTNPITGLPKDRSFEYRDLTCNKERCVMVGKYIDDYPKQRPIVLVSDNTGMNWQFVSLPDYLNAELNAVNCHDKYCNAVGYHFDGKKAIPLILISKDNGVRWAVAANISGLPYEQLTYSNLAKVNCANKICIAGGEYNTDSTSNVLLTVSYDNGKSWVLFNTDQTIVGLKTLNCKENECLLAVDLNDSKLGFLQTKDNGKHWDLETKIANADTNFYYQFISGLSFKA